MSTPQEFSRQMGRLGVAVERNADALVRKVAIAATQVVITSTPVDTGRARSNWLASIDDVRSENREPLGEGVAATGPALAEAIAVIRGYDGNSHREVRLQNSLPYIERLNDGYSAQAPAGFIRLGLQAAADAVQGARLLDPGGAR